MFSVEVLRGRATCFTLRGSASCRGSPRCRGPCRRAVAEREQTPVYYATQHHDIRTGIFVTLRQGATYS